MYGRIKLLCWWEYEEVLAGLDASARFLLHSFCAPSEYTLFFYQDKSRDCLLVYQISRKMRNIFVSVEGTILKFLDVKFKVLFNL